MKIRVKKCSYEQVKKRTPKEQKPAKKPNILFRTLLKLVSLPDIWAVKFRAEKKFRSRHCGCICHTAQDTESIHINLRFIHFIDLHTQSRRNTIIE